MDTIATTTTTTTTTGTSVEEQLEPNHITSTTTAFSVHPFERMLLPSSSILITDSMTSVSTMESPSLTTASTAANDLFSSLNQTLRMQDYPALANFRGEFDPDYVLKINSFWLDFSPPQPREHYIMAAIYIIMMAVGCFGNALVVYMFIRCKSLRTPANTLVINLAVSDFFMVAKSPITIYNSFMLGPALGDIGCRVYGFVGGLTGCGSIMTLTAIALDRYNVVVYPLDPLRSTTKLRSRLMLCFIWVYSFCFAVIPSLDIGLSVYVPEGFLTTCGFDYLSESPPARIFMFVFFLGAWCVPFSIITYCYFFILRVVIQANNIQSSKDRNKTEMKLAGIVIGVIGLWFLAWTPYSVVALLGISGNKELITPLGSMIPAIFCKTSACIDPYIYAMIHPRFRMELRRMVLGEEYIQRTSTYRSSIPSMSSTKRTRGAKDFEMNKNNNLNKISENSAEVELEDTSCKVDHVAEVDQSKF